MHTSVVKLTGKAREWRLLKLIIIFRGKRGVYDQEMAQESFWGSSNILPLDPKKVFQN